MTTEMLAHNSIPGIRFFRVSLDGKVIGFVGRDDITGAWLIQTPTLREEDSPRFRSKRAGEREILRRAAREAKGGDHAG